MFARLGYWQLERMTQKEQLFERFESAPELTLAEAIRADAEFARVRAWGRFDTERHLLVDNRIHQGRAGVHVLTPFQTRDGMLVLVNRGWLPMPADRRSLPKVTTDGAPREISGRLKRLESPGPRLGETDKLRTDRWPQLVTWLDHAPVERALAADVERWIILLDAGQPDGFEGRDWVPATMAPATHGAYALQWFSLAAAAIVIWILLGLRNGRDARTEPQRHKETPDDPTR
ncbi:MAG: SURF1 family protein [Xanthomonadales bacterium]